MFRLSRSSAIDYIKCISEKITCSQSGLGTQKPTKDDTDIKTPTLHNYTDVLKTNHCLNEIKKFAVYHKLKTSGSKKEIIARIFSHLYLSLRCIRIQKLFRGNTVRKYIASHGPACKKRSLCTNETDFMTMDPLSQLDFDYFISYADKDGFVYGFDMVSLYNLIEKNGLDTTNPYNRNKLPSTLISNFTDSIRIAHLIKITLDLNLEDETANISPSVATELRALDLFQRIDSLGNYSDPQWFLSLNRNQLVRFGRELHDIFAYRAQLLPEVKRNICPPHGDPFYNVNLQYIQYNPDMSDVRNFVLSILEKFVYNGINTDSKSLGAYYVLAALTLVNDTAAAALPWLYQSVVYI